MFPSLLPYLHPVSSFLQSTLIFVFIAFEIELIVGFIQMPLKAPLPRSSLEGCDVHSPCGNAPHVFYAALGKDTPLCHRDLYSKPTFAIY